MARQKSGLLSVLGTVFEIVKAIVDEVLNLGGNDEDVRKILTIPEIRRQIAELLVKSISVVQQTLKVIVDYTQPLAEMIKAGNYNWVNSDITAEHFPMKGEGKQEKEVFLFHFGKDMTSEQVIVEMEKRGYRPAKIEDLSALGVAYPELQKQFPIVALGSVWQGPLGYRHVPFLVWYGAKRDLYLCWFGYDWYECCRFLALRK
jgi:hypothetical protein